MTQFAIGLLIGFLLVSEIRQMQQLLALQLEVKTLIETLKGSVVNPADLAQAVANETANRDALTALVTPPGP